MKIIKYIRLRILIVLFVVSGITSFAANDSFNGIEKWLTYYKAQGGTFIDLALLNDASNANVFVPQNFQNYSLYTMNASAFDQIAASNPTGISVTLPYNGTTIQLQLVQAELATDNFQLTKADNAEVI